ncbi:uncharacterized protein LOC123558800 [Mercenaria mercenaria]|uniref:uncharacterized protein LOC123558800 n=2 Tax=Mercenaria mercenaria TaxID=6596 RepID=UPI001E1D599D|nr:uncharacterized protein LOC123558800 [Mercenaria mercenaria]
MRQKQVCPVKSSATYRLYSPTALTNAYQAVMDKGMPVKTAARQYAVPHNTLRDRVKGRVDPETLKSGPPPLFSVEEEAEFVKHLTDMAKLGYGYTVQEIVDKASNYAVHLKHRSRDKPLTIRWFAGFKDRWNLKVLKPRSLSNCRALSLNEEVVAEYFQNLETVMKCNDLMDKPECIYNFDEKGVQTEHAPPYIVTAMSRTEAINSTRSSITTILGCGNALGTQIPPFFVFKGQRMRKELLEGSTPGSSGTVTDSGWSNSDVFLEYLQEHFIKYVQRGNKEQPLLLIFDGHRSHINMPVIEWAQHNNILLFVLPAHTSHALQPLDVGCFGPLQKIYNYECHKFLRECPETKITRYNVAALGSSSYVKGLSNSNLRSAFEKTGIYPFNPSAISDDQFAPSKPYSDELKLTETQESTANCQHGNENTCREFFRAAEEFVEKKKVTYNSKKHNKGISGVVAGKEITNHNIVNEIAEIQKSKPNKQKQKMSKSLSASSSEPKKRMTSKVPSVSEHVERKKRKLDSAASSQKPGPSGCQIIPVSDSESDLSAEEEMSADDLCCVCKQFQPKEMKNCVSLVFVKWAKCDVEDCPHWTHLKFCCNTSVIRLNDTFYCPCHNKPNTEE